MTIEGFISQKDDLLITAYAILEAEGATREAKIIKNCEAELSHLEIQHDAKYYSLSFKVLYPEYNLLKPHILDLDFKSFRKINNEVCVSSNLDN